MTLVATFAGKAPLAGPAGRRLRGHPAVRQREPGGRGVRRATRRVRRRGGGTPAGRVRQRRTRPARPGEPGPPPSCRPPASLGRYPAPGHDWDAASADPVAGDTVTSWYSHTGSVNPPHASGPLGEDRLEYRVNYLLTENTPAAPMGGSLGFLIQADGDERRNEFLNAAWVKAVLLIRPGHELEALGWLTGADVEGEGGGRRGAVRPADRRAALRCGRGDSLTGAARCAGWSGRAGPSCRRRRPAPSCPSTARSRRSAHR